MKTLHKFLLCGFAVLYIQPSLSYYPVRGIRLIPLSYFETIKSVGIRGL